jgi:CxxC-x17-CxxC domain-containing protein
VSVLRCEYMENFNRDDRSGPRRDFGRRDFGKRGFGGHGGRDGRGPREMHKAVCANCGKDCEVPFEPTDGRPVYCSECFEKKDGGQQAPRNFQDRGRDGDRDRGSRRPDFERRDGPRPHEHGPHESHGMPGPRGPELLEEVNRKLDKIMEMLAASPKKEEVQIEQKEVKKAPKKKSPTSKK